MDKYQVTCKIFSIHRLIELCACVYTYMDGWMQTHISLALGIWNLDLFWHALFTVWAYLDYKEQHKPHLRIISTQSFRSL